MQIVSKNFELRYFSADASANGETDFKGETSTLSTQQRIDYLNTYARQLPRLFDDFSLEQPIVPLETARERLSQIKPQPPCTVRNRIVLDRWKWVGYSDKSVQKPFPATQCVAIEPQNWRCFLQWELAAEASLANRNFSLGEAAILGFDAQQTLYYISEGQAISVQLGQAVQTLKVELDFVSRQWNLFVNGALVADFVPFSNTDAEEASYFTAPLENDSHTVQKIWGVGYHRLTESAFEPFSIQTFIDVSRTPPLQASQMQQWNEATCDDTSWQAGALPIVHGGERFAGQDLYLRKTVFLKEVPPYAQLFVESLTPGGEVYVNGRLAALIQDECCHKIDVTAFVMPGENLFAIRVYADTVKPCDKMTHTHTDLHTGWFAGRMHLDLLPLIYLDDVFSWTESIGTDSAVQRVQVSVKGQRGMPSAQAVAHVVCVKMQPWFPQEGPVCAQASWQTNVTPNWAETSEATLLLTAPQLWTANAPHLYQITVELKDSSGNAVDDYIITTGVRTVSQEGGIFRINGAPELLRAPLLFGARPPMDKIAAWDRCPPAEYYVQELLMVRRMNGNGVRMSVHDRRTGGSNDARVCELADQLGVMLVWQTTTWLRVTSATNLDLDELATCIRQVRNHPSIVIWQPSNHPSWKSWDTVMRVYRKLHETVMALDQSRLLSPSADSRRMKTPRWDDGFTDFYGNACETCDPIWTADKICRGNMDYMLGYGNEWSALRQWPNVEAQNLPSYMESTGYIPSYLHSKSRAYFNFEHDEIIGQPNWRLHQGKPTYKIKSYEYYYDEGSIGRELSFDEWQTSQAWQALGAYETVAKCRWLDYDGLCWCNLRGGINTGTYQKSLLDYEGQPKLAYYANRMAFQDVLACSQNVDMVIGPEDTIPLIVLNVGNQKTVTVQVEIVSPDKTTVFLQEYTDIVLPEGRTVSPVEHICVPQTVQGLYAIYYTVSQA